MRTRAGNHSESEAVLDSGMVTGFAAQLDKARAVNSISNAARLLHQFVLSTFAYTGRPPARGEIERNAGEGYDPGVLMAELEGVDLLAFDPSGEIRAAYPFSPTPTAIEVSWEGGPAVYAMCAIDALGMAAMLGKAVTITASEPGTGARIEIDVDGNRARWRPAAAVVAAAFNADMGSPCVDRSCGNINFFADREAAAQWLRADPALTGLVLDQTDAVAAAVEQFGSFMRQPRAAETASIKSAWLAESQAGDWVPGACTLPSEEQSLRRTDFYGFFGESLVSLRRTSPHQLQVELRPHPGVAARAAELAAKETDCCSFFTFHLAIGHNRVDMTISVQPQHEPVLEALDAWMRSQLGGHA